MVQGTFWLGPRLAIDLLDAAWIFSYGALVFKVTSHAQPSRCESNQGHDVAARGAQCLCFQLLVRLTFRRAIDNPKLIRASLQNPVCRFQSYRLYKKCNRETRETEREREIK